MRITITLATPARAENTGAAARTMKTVGFSGLRVVDSQAHLEPAVRWAAHRSGGIIDSIRVFRILAESLHDVDFAVATITHSRAKYHYYTTSIELMPLLEEKSSWTSHAALVFGRENSRLTNEELALADILAGMPMMTDYPSFDLGQAVMVYCY